MRLADCMARHVSEPAQMWLIATGYIMVTASLGFVSPFLVLYWTDGGLTVSEISYVFATQNVVASVCGGAWGMAIDYLHGGLSIYRGHLLAFCTLMTAVILASHMAITPHSSWFVYLAATVCLNVFQPCIMSCFDSVVMQSATVTMSSSSAVEDSSHIRAMKAVGRFKPISSLSYGVCATLGGVLASSTPLGTASVFTVAAPASLLFTMLLLLTDLRTPSPTTVRPRDSEVILSVTEPPVSPSPSVLLDSVATLSTNTPLFCATWILVFFAMGTGFTVVSTFAFLYWKTALGLSNWVLGLSVFFTIQFELLLYPQAARIVSHQQYRPRVFVLCALSVLGLRLALTSVVTQGWMVLLLQLPHGLTTSLITIAFLDQWNQFIAPAQKTLVISVVFIFLSCVAPVVTVLLGAVVYNSDPTTLFLTTAAFEFVCIAVFLCLPSYTYHH